MQAKLLRVLQERRYARVGSTVEEDADVRVLAATNRDLRQEVAEQRFREDLFYRLHVVPLHLPPLRDHPEDIPVLAELFLERTAARYRDSSKRFLGDLDQLADTIPLVGAWLGHAAATRRIVREKYQHLSPEQRWVAAVEENVLVQLENLRTHPAGAAKLARGELNLHGWVYSLETGEVYAFRPEEGEFMPLSESKAT